jgi:hypothetical protein
MNQMRQILHQAPAHPHASLLPDLAGLIHPPYARWTTCTSSSTTRTHGRKVYSELIVAAVLDRLTLIAPVHMKSLDFNMKSLVTSTVSVRRTRGVDC